MGQDTLLQGEASSVVGTTDSDHVTLPYFTQSISSNFCGHSLLIKSMEFAFAISGSREQGKRCSVHPGAAHRLPDATKKL